MCLFSPSTRLFFIGYKTFPWSLSSKNPRSKPSQVNQKHQVFSSKGRRQSPYMTHDRRSKRVPTISWKVRFLFLSFLLYFLFFKETKKSQFLSFIIDEICKSPFMAKLSSTAQNRLSRQTKENRLSRQNRLLRHKIAFHGILNMSFFNIYVQ